MSTVYTTKTALIENALKQEFPSAKAYQPNSAAVRVRIIDERFQGKSNSERERMVDPLLEKLPTKLQADITILLLLAPSETKTSLLNLEFEQPTRSQL